MSSITGLMLGRYQPLEQIGQGGMATVYKAYDPAQDRYVAIKVLSSALAQNQEFSKRFEREARVVMQLEHSHIVPVEDYGEGEGYAYLVMPYLKVGSLADRLEKGPLTFTEGAHIFGQIASALDFAHREGVVHRDVKPANILLDEEGNALLADFGLARIHDASVSLTGSALLGTPTYMSPEVARGDKADARSDQYSLGIMLYQLATEQVPFKAETPMAVLLMHMIEPIPIPRSVNPRVPEPIERVILKATAKDPDDRFASVREMNSAFQSALAHMLDPTVNPAPDIPLPTLDAVTEILPASGNKPSQRKKRGLRVAGLAMLLLLLLLACPVAGFSPLNLLGRSSSSAAGSGLSVGDMSGAQLTALVGTIQAMSTDMAGSTGSPLPPDQIQTAVIETLQAMDGTPISEEVSTDTTATVPLGVGDGNATPSSTQAPILRKTLGPSPTFSRTPTKTRTPTPGPSPTPTASTVASPTPTTSTPPTLTQTPTSTNAPSLTPAPTATAAGNVCSTASLGGFSVNGLNASWTLTNNGATTIEITETYMNWPSSNEELIEVYLGGTSIWDESDGSPPTTLGSDWEGGSREVAPSVSKPYKFEFDKNAVSSGYSLTVTLNDTCQISASG